jgi:GDP/UDP-N,N'-diacetylbacillosamine 2-epimerase (hydrolysing)
MPPKPKHSPRRRICFVTGTRAEFGLMRPVLDAIAAHPRLKLQIIATGMHLSDEHGKTINDIRKDFKIDATVPWRGSPAQATGRATSALADAFAKLKPDIVLIVGDRVEAFAAATAAHLSNIPVAHVHGGDRALGQVDDTLRHAITKLAHIHFPATLQSAKRISKLGEDPWRIHQSGSPGIEGIERIAAPRAQITDFFQHHCPPGFSGAIHHAPITNYRFLLILLHPIEPNNALEFTRAKTIARAAASIPVEKIIIIYPNNDPGSAGIIRCWKSLAKNPRFIITPDISRPLFLGLLRDATMLIGNSSSGIIEAASFKTPVIDVGPRQFGRERCKDVRNIPYRHADIAAAGAHIWNNGNPRRSLGNNPYTRRGTSQKISAHLADLIVNQRLLRKIIAY